MILLKDLGVAQNILRKQIRRNRRSKRLWLSQECYIKKVLGMFGITN